MRENDDLTLLAAAAQSAGEIALRYWKRNPKAWDKGSGNDPVTEADIAVNAHLETVLRTGRPGYGWLSEETPDTSDRLTPQRTFVIDPIDGTRAFIAGEDTFAVSLAVADAGRVIAAAVGLPALGRLYTASTIAPALKNGQPIHASTRAAIDGASVLSPKANFLPDHWPGGVPDLRRSFRPSLAYRLCLVAEGRHDAMLTLRPTWEWDIAAGSLIASRAGATVTDGLGAALHFNQPDPRAPGVIAASPGLHAALLQRRLAQI